MDANGWSISMVEQEELRQLIFISFLLYRYHCLSCLIFHLGLCFRL